MILKSTRYNVINNVKQYSKYMSSSVQQQLQVVKPKVVVIGAGWGGFRFAKGVL